MLRIASGTEYLDYCDRFYFAVASDFPRDLLPADEGLIVADRFGGEIVREAPIRALGPARRKAMLIRFGRAAASRLQLCSIPALALMQVRGDADPLAFAEGRLEGCGHPIGERPAQPPSRTASPRSGAGRSNPGSAA